MHGQAVQPHLNGHEAVGRVDEAATRVFSKVLHNIAHLAVALALEAEEHRPI